MPLSDLSKAFPPIRQYQLELLPSGAFFSDYDMDLDPAVLNEFATLAVPMALSWLQAPTTSWDTQFNNPDRLYERQGVETLLKCAFRGIPPTI